ncbi:MAG: hypothetical protein R3E12_18500 [Candidatus Eisenbacteria bacterium]
MHECDFDRGTGLSVFLCGATPDALEAELVVSFAYALEDFPSWRYLISPTSYLDPSNRPAKWMLVVAAAVTAGRYDDAIDTADDYLLQFGEDAEIHTWAGVAHLCEGEPEDARIHLQRAADLSPTLLTGYAEAFLVITLQAMGLGDAADAQLRASAARCEQSMVRAPDNRRWRFWNAFTIALSGRYERALQAIDGMDASLALPPLGTLSPMFWGILGNDERLIENLDAGLAAPMTMDVLLTARPAYASNASLKVRALTARAARLDRVRLERASDEAALALHLQNRAS